MNRTLTRRRLLQGLAPSAAGFLILNNAGSARAYAANEKLNIALIGVGGRGKWYDPLAGKIINHAEADALLRRPYRPGWTL